MSGRIWLLEEPLTLIGRSMGCHIRIDETHVSRVQCEIIRDGLALQVRNIGQRNPTLVNGAATDHAVLALGDVISFCGVSLILDHSPEFGASKVSSGADARTTQSFEDIVHLQSSFDAGTYSRNAPLVADLHSLVGIVRALGRATSLEVLRAQLADHLTERLRADRIWTGLRMRADGEIVLFPPATKYDTRTAPFDVMRDACTSAVGLMVKGTGEIAERWVLAAPLLHGGECFGALAVSRSDSRGKFAATELQYLVAIADCCAPLIRAVERFEQLQRDVAANSQQPLASLTLLGESSAMRALQGDIRRAAAAKGHVILQGETGVGKELAARMLHDLSTRGSGPYIVVNCAAIASELFESELFGHERGAFTGANRRRKGLFELAQGGTLFLDEITELSLENQAHLLRAVETGAFRPVGAEKELKVDVRVLCATNRPLPDPQQRHFRTDLYHRLSGFVLRIRPLRERKEDIPILAAHFLKAMASHSINHPLGFTERALETLISYSWPGNVRELRNVVERACYMASGPYIESENLQIENVASSAPIHTENATLDDLERLHLVEMLKRHNNNVLDVARALGVSRSALYYRLSRHGIKPRKVSRSNQ
ncbi:MAG: sigma 54-interacting transcriptional regulator [Candidatus Hydrogenedentes bacterium]|nr:sigma 54-interacting transcriptional regulator [Candidatus Hydrogenedentota bacterium]